MKVIRVFLAVLGLATLFACAPYPEAYIRHHLGQGTQEQITAELGQPAKKETLPDGGSRWTYHHHVSYATYLTYSNPDSEVCYTYVLTFDARNVLQQWDKSSRNCGAVN